MSSSDSHSDYYTDNSQEFLPLSIPNTTVSDISIEMHPEEAINMPWYRNPDLKFDFTTIGVYLKVRHFFGDHETTDLDLYLSRVFRVLELATHIDHPQVGYLEHFFLIIQIRYYLEYGFFWCYSTRLKPSDDIIRGSDLDDLYISTDSWTISCIPYLYSLTILIIHII